ncbi:MULTISPECIES: S10 family serine carboxypeptidase-like protein [Nitrospirillum]|uniref:Carboxypeptidase C (Cathepsin A) n=1 Tax=Nitrospirillum amazonense TaxID=28077 RepID=A0A560FL19_9PROT|nr:peptidase S10 [Nitrospirillum amazonense]MEC4590901.1 hypothetical protein [Nitrospirillum amazonense]TWB22282.1 carboxypeptidase C (cathepsin A) [Nitrospirillum amazonense]
MRAAIRNGISAVALALAGCAAHDPAMAPPSGVAQQITLAGKPLRYVAEAATLDLTDAQGVVRGHIFYVAYHVPGQGGRPVTFLWNGGPGANSTLLHFEAFGPKRLEGGALVDNAQTLLADSDLVFVDPVGTGFSRPATAQDGLRFYSTLGDQSSITDFVQAWTQRHADARTPVYLIGESFGVWRAAGVAEALEKRGRPVAGVVLISGGIPVGPVLPKELVTALKLPGRAAAAQVHGRLPASLAGTSPSATADATRAWAEQVYAPALAHLGDLSAQQKAALAQDVAHHMGVDPSLVDRTSLTVSSRQFLNNLLPGRRLDTFDMRISTPLNPGAGQVDAEEPGAAVMVRYLRETLGYRTDLPYLGLEKDTDPGAKPVGEQWDYNSGDTSPAAFAAAIAVARAGEGPPGAEPWIRRAMEMDGKLRVFAAAGLYDSLNSCAANEILKAKLEPGLSARLSVNCYGGGHMMYRDAEARVRLSADLGRFITRQP